MQINKVMVSNYRNLDGVEIEFDQRINFVIGENELGKSNLLELFDILFSRRRFADEDFFDKGKPIRVDFCLKLSGAEQGAFEDYFDPSDSSMLNIWAFQEYSELDDEITFNWNNGDEASPVAIPSYLFRQVNFLLYSSLRTPQDELVFYRGRGSGQFLRYLVDEFVNKEASAVAAEAVDPVIQQIQSIFDRLPPLKKHGLGLYTDDGNPSDLVSRLLKLKGIDGYDIHKSGFGIQFTALLLLSILERLVRLKRSKNSTRYIEERSAFTATEYKVFQELYLSDPALQALLEPVTAEVDGKYVVNLSALPKDELQKLDERVIEHITKRKLISFVVGLDEPEIHLHPYMQRSLVKYLYRILQNEEPDFMFLLKQHFDIDALNGQVLLVSHSPLVLFDSHKHLVRFCRDSNAAVLATSGATITLSPSDQKHLALNFPYITEAFFARCAVIVEGETEFGALPRWADKLIGDLDGHGVTIIRAGGINSVPAVTGLLNSFHISNVSIIDKDTNNDTNPRFTSIAGLRTTGYRDFEEELFEAVRRSDPAVSALFDAFSDYEGRELRRLTIQTSKLASIATKYGISASWDSAVPQYSLLDASSSGDANLIKAACLAWLDINKSVTLGRHLGNTINTHMIPVVFIQLLNDAEATV